MRLQVLLLIIAFSLISCGGEGGYKKIILKHPETFDVKTCRADILRRAASYEKCVERYKKLGYEVWGKR